MRPRNISKVGKMYHSEPFTRTLVGNWQANQFNRNSRRQGLAETNDFPEQWEKISSVNATKEERIGYFRLAEPTLMFFGLVGLVTTMVVFLAALFAGALGYWIGLLVFEIMVFAMLTLGHHRELQKSETDQTYLPSFDSKKLAVCIGLAVPATVVVTYLMMMIL